VLLWIIRCDFCAVLVKLKRAVETHRLNAVMLTLANSLVQLDTLLKCKVFMLKEVGF